MPAFVPSRTAAARGATSAGALCTCSRRRPDGHATSTFSNRLPTISLRGDWSPTPGNPPTSSSRGPPAGHGPVRAGRTGAGASGGQPRSSRRHRRPPSLSPQGLVRLRPGMGGAQPDIRRRASRTFSGDARSALRRDDAGARIPAPHLRCRRDPSSARRSLRDALWTHPQKKRRPGGGGS